MKRSLIFLLSFCLVVFIASFYVAASKGSTAAYSLSVVSFACFVALYAVGVLGYKIGGNHISLEAKVETLEKESTELKQLVTALFKSIYVVAYAAGHWDCRTETQYKIMEEYLLPIGHLIDPDAKAQADADIARIFTNENPQPGVPAEPPAIRPPESR